jgi:hypothetical protein
MYVVTVTTQQLLDGNTCVVDQEVDAGAAERCRSVPRCLLQLLEGPGEVEGQDAVLLAGVLAALIRHCLSI